MAIKIDRLDSKKFSAETATKSYVEVSWRDFWLAWPFPQRFAGMLKPVDRILKLIDPVVRLMDLMFMNLIISIVTVVMTEPLKL